MSDFQPFPVTPELRDALRRAKLRWDAGTTTTIEAAAEQLEALLEVSPSPELRSLLDALKSANSGDREPLSQFLGVPLDCLRARDE